MTAMTESGLLNLDHGDQDSLGLFQQRPSQGWGTPAQIMDPDLRHRRLRRPAPLGPELAADRALARRSGRPAFGRRRRLQLRGELGTRRNDPRRGRRQRRLSGSLRAGHGRSRRHGDRARTAARIRRPGGHAAFAHRGRELRPRPAREALCVGRGRAGGLRLLGSDDGGVGERRSRAWCTPRASNRPRASPVDRDRARARRPRARAGLGLAGAGPRRPRRHLPR